jgi:hypothetical protein
MIIRLIGGNMKREKYAEGKQSKKTCFRWCSFGLLLIAPLFFGSSLTLQAKDSNSIPELPSIEVKPVISLPVATKVVEPNIYRALLGTEVRMTFKIGKDGRPYAIRRPMDFDQDKSSLGSIMSGVLVYWRFEPARDAAGKALNVKVALPVKVVSPGKANANQYACIQYPQPVLLAVLD